MGMFDKIQFWKKKDEFALPSDERSDSSFSEPMQMPSDSGFSVPPSSRGITEPEIPSAAEDFGRPSKYQQQSFQPQTFDQQPRGELKDQQLQLLSSKLDTIKAQLDTVLQRFDRIERREEVPFQERWQQRK